MKKDARRGVGGGPPSWRNVNGRRLRCYSTLLPRNKIQVLIPVYPSFATLPDSRSQKINVCWGLLAASYYALFVGLFSCWPPRRNDVRDLSIHGSASVLVLCDGPSWRSSRRWNRYPLSDGTCACIANFHLASNNNVAAACFLPRHFNTSFWLARNQEENPSLDIYIYILYIMCVLYIYGFSSVL